MPKETIGFRNQRSWYQLIDHTADTGFRVRGSSPKELFEHAAFALFDIMADLKNVSPDQSKDINLSAADRVSLMVDWLSELNYFFFTEGLIFSDFEVYDIEENHLRARVKGERYMPAKHIIHTEVKAVTYHGMYIRQNKGEWEAQIILDL
ncbi:MAG TPA: archease [Balneolales bacterium]|nr:archease [Balneolales bacterium]